jgi:hypothetical protein
LLQSLQSSNVCHVRREANRAAHLLAKNTLMSMEVTVWMGDYPSFIQSMYLLSRVLILDMEYKIIF